MDGDQLVYRKCQRLRSLITTLKYNIIRSIMPKNKGFTQNKIYAGCF